MEAPVAKAAGAFCYLRQSARVAHRTGPGVPGPITLTPTPSGAICAAGEPGISSPQAWYKLRTAH